MYSTTTLVKNSKFSGRIVGTHQQLDEAARKALKNWLPRSCYFPSDKEILHFEGTRGPDGLKRKSPGVDEPSHMMTRQELGEDDDYASDEAFSNAPGAFGDMDDTQTSRKPVATFAAASANDVRVSPVHTAGGSHQDSARDIPSEQLQAATRTSDQNRLDQRSVVTMILDHRWNLVQALKAADHVRAAFEAAWLAHMITDGLTPAHHFPLSDVQEELMTQKEMMQVFGQPVKGIMHGRSLPETMRNNWLYWGAKGHMTQHIAYEYGVAVLAAALPQKAIIPELTPKDFAELDIKEIFYCALEFVRKHKMYDEFRKNGWTTDLALATKNILLPEIVRTITLGWYSAAAEAYALNPPKTAKRASHNSQQKVSE